MTKKQHIRIVSMMVVLKISDVEAVIDARNKNIVRQVSQGVPVFMKGFGTFTNEYQASFTSNLPNFSGKRIPGRLKPKFNAAPAFIEKLARK